ncbi:alpha/beta-hydrolase [Dentipellis sp. KUC8613]|nr:alpha/beta-hydrolase [Dentipellis sp. KUC8613]
MSESTTTYANEVPFKIAIPDGALTLLHEKLAVTRFPNELEDAGWEYGAPLDDVRRLGVRWKNGFNWRAQEAKLNAELPMFTRNLDVEGHGTLNVHYVHKRSEVEAAIPLLFIHGWPGSFLEVRKILPLLTASSPDHPSFHVVALTLPGYAFSEAPRKKGFQLVHYGELANKLMLSLGYKEYVTQGGDWGSLIATYTASKYGPDHVKAAHVNFPLSVPPTPTTAPLQSLKYLLSWYTPAEKEGLKRTQEFAATGRGYWMEQSTQPQTLGYSLADSPIGLLAWVYEKLVNWTDKYPWEDDEVLTWVSVYWFSRSGPAASIRIYYELSKSGEAMKMSRPTVPLGLSRFPRELRVLPKDWSWTMGNVVFDAEHESGGHFAAHEKPEELVGDLRKMFGKGGPAFGVVLGKNGYVPA